MKQHGGKRAGAGRKSLPANQRKQVKTVRLKQAQIDALIAEFGRFQDAIETLVNRHLVEDKE
ncbi:MAG: hypothetical protein ACPG8W_17960 [Candidatus Promineifilaceae bacterium]